MRAASVRSKGPPGGWCLVRHRQCRTALRSRSKRNGLAHSMSHAPSRTADADKKQSERAADEAIRPSPYMHWSWHRAMPAAIRAARPRSPSEPASPSPSRTSTLSVASTLASSTMARKVTSSAPSWRVCAIRLARNVFPAHWTFSSGLRPSIWRFSARLRKSGIGQLWTTAAPRSSDRGRHRGRDRSQLGLRNHGARPSRQRRETTFRQVAQRQPPQRPVGLAKIGIGYCHPVGPSSIRAATPEGERDVTRCRALERCKNPMSAGESAMLCHFSPPRRAAMGRPGNWLRLKRAMIELALPIARTARGLSAMPSPVHRRPARQKARAAFF